MLPSIQYQKVDYRGDGTSARVIEISWLFCNLTVRFQFPSGAGR